MGWTSVSKEGEILSEDKHGRPVQQGEEGNLLAIIQEDYGHKVVIDLVNAVIAIDPETWEFQNGRFYLHNPTTLLFVADDTNIIGEMGELEQIFEIKRDEQGRKVRDENGKLVEVRTDIIHPLKMRPIWFSRHISTLPAPVKVIGLQVTLPELQGGHNVKKMVMLYPDGRLGISG